MNVKDLEQKLDMFEKEKVKVGGLRKKLKEQKKDVMNKDYGMEIIEKYEMKEDYEKFVTEKTADTKVNEKMEDYISDPKKIEVLEKWLDDNIHEWWISYKYRGKGPFNVENIFDFIEQKTNDETKYTIGFTDERKVYRGFNFKKGKVNVHKKPTLSLSKDFENNLKQYIETVPEELKEVVEIYQRFRRKPVEIKESLIGETNNQFMEKYAKLSDNEKILVAKKINKEGIVKLGCNGFGDYKEPSSCGKCVDAKENMEEFGIKGMAEFKGDREYDIPQSTIEGAISAYLGKDVFNEIYKKQDAAEKAEFFVDKEINKLTDIVRIYKGLEANDVTTDMSEDELVRFSEMLLKNGYDSFSMIEKKDGYWIVGKEGFETECYGGYSKVRDTRVRKVAVFDNQGMLDESIDRYLFRSTDDGVIGDKYEFSIDSVAIDDNDVKVKMGQKEFNMDLENRTVKEEESDVFMPQRIYGHMMNAVEIYAENNKPNLSIPKNYDLMEAFRGIETHLNTNGLYEGTRDAKTMVGRKKLVDGSTAIFEVNEECDFNAGQIEKRSYQVQAKNVDGKIIIDRI